MGSDTKQFLEQISLQLRNLPQPGEDGHPVHSQRITPQPQPLSALDLSRISDQHATVNYMSSREDEGSHDFGQSSQADKLRQARNESSYLNSSQGAISADRKQRHHP